MWRIDWLFAGRAYVGAVVFAVASVVSLVRDLGEPTYLLFGAALFCLALSRIEAENARRHKRRADARQARRRRQRQSDAMPPRGQ